MSSPMPEFEMPTEVDVPPRPDRAAGNAGSAAHGRVDSGSTGAARAAYTAEPDASGRRRRGRGPRTPWRLAAAAGVVGLIVGAAIPGGIQWAERAAASADEAGLRAAATDYLQAIADGRGADAAAMVPLPEGTVAMPDAVLADAERITDVEVRFVQIEATTGSVQATFRLGSIEAEHTLQAERMDGRWFITTSLAEPLMPMWWGPGAFAQISGQPVPDDGTGALFPGLYRFDQTATAMLTMRSEPFAVDGDPATPVESYLDVQLRQEIADAAGERALLAVERCRAQQTCSLASEGELRLQGTYLQGVSGNDYDIAAQISIPDALGTLLEVRVRVTAGSTGVPEHWLCSDAGEYSDPVDPCPEPA